eukprot:TRINITY_DN48732_c0_g1_i1.p1 TRINITY_DN48732_c0_g1~~TRINITY_DN48732_c0_g1_i1.p1  ORF type:complete len:333 (+),score=49.52 TRINITY_DN48732_c0_g1_i1:221-1219(+)
MAWNVLGSLGDATDERRRRAEKSVPSLKELAAERRRRAEESAPSPRDLGGERWRGDQEFGGSTRGIRDVVVREVTSRVGASDERDPVRRDLEESLKLALARALSAEEEARELNARLRSKDQALKREKRRNRKVDEDHAASDDGEDLDERRNYRRIEEQAVRGLAFRLRKCESEVGSETSELSKELSVAREENVGLRLEFHTECGIARAFSRSQAAGRGGIDNGSNEGQIIRQSPALVSIELNSLQSKLSRETVKVEAAEEALSEVREESAVQLAAESAEVWALRAEFASGFSESEQTVTTQALTREGISGTEIKQINDFGDELVQNLTRRTF